MTIEEIRTHKEVQRINRTSFQKAQAVEPWGKAGEMCLNPVLPLMFPYSKPNVLVNASLPLNDLQSGSHSKAACVLYAAMKIDILIKEKCHNPKSLSRIRCCMAVSTIPTL